MKRGEAKVIFRRSDGVSAREWCRQNNVPSQTVQVYLDKGYLVDDACELAKKAHEESVRKHEMLKVNGIPICKILSPSAYATIKKKIIKTGCSYEEALKAYKHNCDKIKAKNKEVKYITFYDLKK